MNKKISKHVFISYVREDSPHVERLASELRKEGIEVWLDRERLQPGERWQEAIRRAIQTGLFFIACFSSSYAARAESYMNEELTIAIEQLRLSQPNRIWFVPVLLSECEIPDRSIGGGETIRSFQWLDLYRDWDAGVRRITHVINTSAGKRTDDTQIRGVAKQSASFPVSEPSFVNRLAAESLLKALSGDEKAPEWKYGYGNCSNCGWPLSEAEAFYEPGTGYIHPYDCLNDG